MMSCCNIKKLDFDRKIKDDSLFHKRLSFITHTAMDDMTIAGMGSS